MNNFKAVRGSAWREVVKEAYLWLKTISVLAALISGEAMEVACCAFFSSTAVVPAELQALHDASSERRTGRRVSIATIFLKRRVQFNNQHYSRHTNVSASRPRHLKILGLDKHLRTSNKFANEFLNFSSCSFSYNSSQDCKAIQHHNPVIYAGEDLGLYIYYNPRF
ncbi:unnamed protein product [Sphagnum jensenii]|uniref:Uncharacterized protein n=1 Tax=Sphagnum jensenii TaxID=128206 RepID=A0ABP1AA59_9BRYO